jgi:hypothetical protein
MKRSLSQMIYLKILINSIKRSADNISLLSISNGSGTKMVAATQKKVKHGV